MRKFKSFLTTILLTICLLTVFTADSAVLAADTDTASEENWIGAWSTSPVKFNLKEILNMGCIKRDTGLHNLMFRTRIQPTVSGENMRVTLSNEFGTGPLTVDAMTVARGCEKLGSAYKPGTKKDVTFQGQRSVTIAPGETVTSDPD